MEISFAFSPSPPPFDLGDTLPVKGPENFGPGKKGGTSDRIMRNVWKDAMAVEQMMI